MSTPTAQCPHCFTRVPAPEGAASVDCPSCERTFTPTANVPAGRKNPNVPLAKAIPVDGAAAKPAKPADAEKPAKADTPADDLPRAKPATTARRSRRDEDADDRPRTRSRRRYEDDDDRRPSKAKKSGGSALPLILIAGGVLLVLTLGGAAAVAVAVLSQPVTQVPTYTAPPAGVQVDEPRVPRGNWNDNQPFLDPKVDEPRPDPRQPGDFPGGFGPGGPGDPFAPPKPQVPKVAPKYADVVPQEIKPAKLADDKTEVKLPGKVADACSGGGGRFFLLHLSDKRQVAVFDVNEGKVVKYLPLAADNAKIAAGMNKLVVAYPDQDTLVRFDLTTFEKEATVKNPLGGTIRHLCMGSASAGPLLVSYTRGVGQLDAAPLTFLDPTTFKELDVDQPQTRVGQANVRDAMHFRASPDGTVFAAWCTSHSPQGLNSIVLTGGSAKGYYEHDSVGHLVPGPDGHLYTGRGLYTNQLKKVDKGQDRVGNVLLPAAEGAMHLRLAGNADGQPPFPGGMPGDGKQMKLEVKMAGDDRAVHTIKGVALQGNEAWAAGDFTNDKRVHFAPTAHLLAVIPPTNDAVVVHKFDLEAAFEASGVDYLFVTSRPLTAVPGKAYSYQIVAKSKKGGVKYKLESGPKGMAVSAGGELTWAVPHDFAAPEPVLVTVADASGQEIFHSFELAPGDGKRPAGPAVGAAKIGPGGPDLPDPKGGTLVTAPDRVFELKPPNIQEKASVQLPAAADAVCVGGGGRFLIFRLGEKKQLAVLDVTAGRVVKYLPLAEADALVAAGMTKLFVLNKSANALLRYDLEKFEKELTAQNPLGGTPSVMLMGHSSDGPLFVGGPDVGTDPKGYGFINPRTMKELKVPVEGVGLNGQPATGPAIGDRFGGRVTGVAVSPDGRTLVWADDWGGNKVMTLGEKAGKVKGDNIGGGQNRGPLVPGPDGHLFGGHGFYNSDLKKVGDAKQLNTHGTHVPATSGPWYVGAIEAERWSNPSAKRRVFVGMTADDRAKFALDAVDGLPAGDYQPWDAQQAKKVPLAARLHLVPEAEILAVLDDGMEKVHLHRVAMKGVLEKADADRLLVVSRPRPAVRGAKWAYTPEVWSKKGGVKVKVESGPDGMKADGGTVSWDVPAKFAEDEPTVILTVSDAGGQETFHTFTLSVRSDAPPAAAVIKPTLPPLEAVKPADPGKGVSSAAFPLKPTAAKDGTDVDLSGPADAACLAAGGRFILFRIPSKKEVAVFDVVDGKVVKQLPLAEDGALVAGGRGHAFVVSPKAGVLQRWSLSTFEKEATTKLPDGLTVQVAVMGHSSDGPVFLGGGDRGWDPNNKSGFYDPLTLKKIDLKKPADAQAVGEVKPSPSPADAGSVFCSPDGRVWAWFNRGSSPSGLRSLVIDGDFARGFSSHVSVGPIVVGPEGNLFTGAGVFAGDQSKVIAATVKGVKVGPVNSWREVQIDNGGYFQPLARTPVPASDGPFYVWFPQPKQDARRPGPPPPGGEKPKAEEEPPPSLKMIGAGEPLAALKDVRGLADPTDQFGGVRPPRPKPGEENRPALLIHQRLFLIPAAELLAVLSADGTKVHIHAFKARELMDKSGQDYLVLMGRPPQLAARGKKWSYTPDVWSKKGGVKVEVASGPPGLKAEGGGVAWDVPADLLDNRVTVELKITDLSGKSIQVRFPLSLDGTAPGAPVLLGDASGGTGGGGKAPGENSNAVVTKHKDTLTATASSEWNGWPVGHLLDGNERTSWFSNNPDNTSTDRKPVVTLTFPKDVTVKRVTVLGNRDPSFRTGYTVSELTLEFLDAKEKVVSKHPLTAAGDDSDFDLKLDKPATVRAVRLTMTKSVNGQCALGELLVE